MISRAEMESVYECTDSFCKGNEKLYELGEIIEHLRGIHMRSFIVRPQRLGVPDWNGHVWYCFLCETKSGKDHRSFNTHDAMWKHLSDKHDHDLDNIRLYVW